MKTIKFEVELKKCWYCSHGIWEDVWYYEEATVPHVLWEHSHDDPPTNLREFRIANSFPIISSKEKENFSTINPSFEEYEFSQYSELQQFLLANAGKYYQVKLKPVAGTITCDKGLLEDGELNPFIRYPLGLGGKSEPLRKGRMYFLNTSLIEKEIV